LPTAFADLTRAQLPLPPTCRELAAEGSSPQPALTTSPPTATTLSRLAGDSCLMLSNSLLLSSSFRRACGPALSMRSPSAQGNDTLLQHDGAPESTRHMQCSTISYAARHSPHPCLALSSTYTTATSVHLSSCSNTMPPTKPEAPVMRTVAPDICAVTLHVLSRRRCLVVQGALWLAHTMLPGWRAIAKCE